MNKEQQELIKDLIIGENSEIITNPYSKVSVRVDPIGVALYDFITGCSVTGQFEDLLLAKTLFAELYPAEYTSLIS